MVEIDYASMGVSAMDGIVSGGKYIALMVLVGAIIWLVVMFLQYDIRFRVKEITGGRKIIYDTKAKFNKKRQCLEILKFRDRAPLPPAEAYETNPRGKKCLEAYRINGQYIYGADKLTADGVLYRPLTTGDREFYINELRIAEERRGMDWVQHMPMIAGFSFLIIMLVIVLVFWGDIMQPAINAQQTSASMMKTAGDITQRQAQIMEDLREIIKKEQVIRDEPAPPPG